MTAVKVICGCVMMLTIFGTSVFGLPNFRDEIPNGYNIPDPCNPGSIWNGVGHQSSAGGDNRNLFGVAFLSNSRTWSKALCQSDSDGDGRSNGLEMGDPNCTWAKGVAPSITTGLSHPGICEPVTSPGCQSVNSFLPATCRQASSSQAPSTQALSSQASSSQAPSSQAPSSQAPSSQAPSSQAPSSQASSSQAPSSQAPSSQSPGTQAPSTKAPSTLIITTKRSGGGSSEATLNRCNILSLVAFVFGTVFIRIMATQLS